MAYQIAYSFIASAMLVMSVVSQARDNCPDHCGDVKIPYPFGIGDNCSMEEKFNVTCNNSATPAPKTYLETSAIEITNISVSSGELRVLQFVGRDCYNQSRSNRPSIWFRRSLAISSSKNSFFAVGCDTYAITQGYNSKDERLTTGCMSLCDTATSVINNSCSGGGCCEVKIPPELKNLTVRLSSYNNHTNVRDFNPCSYAFAVETGWFKFAGVSSFGVLDGLERVPMIVDWCVGDQSCAQAMAAKNVSYCKGESRCVDSRSGFGYLCECMPGYQGNPYLSPGCQDIDECLLGNYCNGTCTNTLGNYSCECGKGFTLTNGTLCIKDVKSKGSEKILIVSLSGVSVGLITLVFVSSILFWVYKKRKLILQKEKFFEQNGGLLLRRILSSTDDQRGSLEMAKIFDEEDLKKATNNYDQILGEGGYGIVYKGVLPDKRVVAIKKPKIGMHTQTESQIEQFVNEVILLMQINHKNIVRLLGCCLDTEVPILVYEFISNGTLFDHIHKRGSNDPSLSWELRLKIATETAVALSYLHYEINTPIVHRDVKTMNILLDEGYTVKVSDFGTSRLVPINEEQLSTLVQGTIGYLDPEYLQSTQLTEKSDVYSFGVVLAELLTGKKAFSIDKSEGIACNLAMYFVSQQEDQLSRVVESEIDFEANVKEIVEVSKLAKRCLRIKSDERPTMKEVAIELQGLRPMSKHPWEKVDTEENVHLLGSPSTIGMYGIDTDVGSIDNSTNVYDTIPNQLILPYNDGR